MRDAAPIRLESYVVGNTGRFELLHIECESEDGKAVGQIISIEAKCRDCAVTFCATHSGGLEVVGRGAVLSCPKCSNRQGISPAVIDSFPGADCIDSPT